MSTTLEVTSLTDNDVKSAKGWKKVYSITMAGMINGVTVTVNLKSDNLELLEEIAEFDKTTQRAMTIDPVNHTLSSYPGAPNATAAIQSSLSQEEQDAADQEETLEELRRQLHDAKDQQDNAENTGDQI